MQQRISLFLSATGNEVIHYLCADESRDTETMMEPDWKTT